MTFKPINDDHAIEAIKFSILISGAVRVATISALEQLYPTFKDQLPALARGTVDLDIGSGQTVTAPSLSFGFLRPDGTPNWNVQIFGNRIIVDCNLYTRWERVWGTAKSYVDSILRIICEKQPDVRIASIELTVSDTFLTDEQTYDLNELIPRSKFLAPVVYQSGSVWHSNSGWFDGGGTQLRTLHNLNCRSVGNETGFAVRIVHFQKCEFPYESERSLADSAGAEIDNSMNKLHDSNKAILSDLLHEHTAQMIGLEKTQ